MPAQSLHFGREFLDDATFNRWVAEGHLIDDAAADRLALDSQSLG